MSWEDPKTKVFLAGKCEAFQQMIEYCTDKKISIMSKEECAPNFNDLLSDVIVWCSFRKQESKEECIEHKPNQN